MSENLLAHESSPYLLQHKDNPVHWRAWGPAALEEARRANKPILLSVGYAACHWCHVMAHESFEDPETAAVMNRLFVNIKVDREERPDIDQIYMAALHALGEQGGWPLTMFLTPDGKPVWGGTYFPKTARYGRPSFVSVLEEVARVAREEPETFAHNSGLLLERLSAHPQATEGTVALGPDLLDRAAARLLGLTDREHGGTKGAPKFPQATLLSFLWRTGSRTGDPSFHDAVLTTLRNICQGGIYDHLAGGFARYAVDDRWLVPHFEKMLYDNAQLLELLSDAFIATGDPLFRDRAAETVAWLTREMATPSGAFAASIDADSEGIEGKFYTWSEDDILAILGPRDGAFFASHYGVYRAGNWEGVNILNRLGTMARLTDEDEDRLAASRARLLAARTNRIRPATDDKILADWNGLTIAALALAGTIFGKPDWIAAASRAFDFITGPMSRAGRLAHSWRDGKSVFPGLATDYANMTKAALALHAATLAPPYLAEAERLAALMRSHHWDPASGGYFLPADDAEALIIRPRSQTDEATPAADSVMAANLIRLWHLTGNESYRDDADAILAAAAPAIAANLFATAGILAALDFRLTATDVVIVHPAAAAPDLLVAAARAHSTPSTILAVFADAADLPPAHPASGKRPVDRQPTAYVCRGETCSLPVTDPAELPVLLQERRLAAPFMVYDS
ncbi:MAG: thioredoxin domain-containing protein [Bauldia sp.]|uniref:thioredoxin domain-containing protein n=1 Tax=Bauldia sp. TaxID=2575872 RepID=UPI001D6EB9A4|nr:thioredoxin domain-containing protein [Bauldia sp.]MCB1498007.1 thioredoxin domain-containing protein [Bauldia sp.]